MGDGMGALPSQKYDMVLLAFMEYYNELHGYGDYIIFEEDIKEFLQKCDEREIEI